MLIRYAENAGFIYGQQNSEGLDWTILFWYDPSDCQVEAQLVVYTSRDDPAEHVVLLNSGYTDNEEVALNLLMGHLAHEVSVHFDDPAE